MNIDLKNITEIVREGVNKFTGTLKLANGKTVTVGFERRQRGWYVELLVTINDRAFQVYDGDNTKEGDFARKLWSDVDRACCVCETLREERRCAQRGMIMAALGATRG